MVFSPRNLINGTACLEVVKMIRPSAPLWIGASPVQTSPHSWEFLIAEASQIKDYLYGRAEQKLEMSSKWKIPGGNSRSKLRAQYTILRKQIFQRLDQAEAENRVEEADEDQSSSYTHAS